MQISQHLWILKPLNIRSSSQAGSFPLKGKGAEWADSTLPEAHFHPSSAGFWSHLHSLSSLLRLRQQLDGDGPAVLHGVLQVNKGVAHVAAHAALPADRHRAGLAEEQQHLGERDKDTGSWAYKWISELHECKQQHEDNVAANRTGSLMTGTSNIELWKNDLFILITPG